jgi:hypothetical protein
MAKNYNANPQLSIQDISSRSLKTEHKKVKEGCYYIGSVIIVDPTSSSMFRYGKMRRIYLSQHLPSMKYRLEIYAGPNYLEFIPGDSQIKSWSRSYKEEDIPWKWQLIKKIMQDLIKQQYWPGPSMENLKTTYTDHSKGASGGIRG